MPFPFRDKQNPTDKFRDKTSEDLLSGLRKQFDQDRKMFFEKSPAWETNTPSASGFARAGGFFDDESMMPSRGRHKDIRSHLDSLAQRHPEFADSLRGPPWASEMGSSGRGFKRGAGSCGDDDTASGSTASTASDPVREHEQEQTDEPGPLRGRQRNNLPQPATMRNTVPDMGQRQQEEETRGQRSWSAPPDNRSTEPQRFVSRLEINPQPVNAQPVDPQPANTTPHNKETEAKTAPQSNVRHIPIFVEGRDQPVINTTNVGEPQQFTSQTQHHFQPQQQKRPAPQQSFNSSPKPFKQQNNMQQQQPHQEEEQQQQQQPQERSEPDSAESDVAPAVPEPPKTLDPISRVELVHHEVSILKEEVDKFSGTSRKDKEYVFLDEMLTRNLLKLDDIETEGRDDVRQARRAAIKSIQECINVLEERCPLATPEEVVSRECEASEESVVSQESGTS